MWFVQKAEIKIEVQGELLETNYVVVNEREIFIKIIIFKILQIIYNYLFQLKLNISNINSHNHPKEYFKIYNIEMYNLRINENQISIYLVQLTFGMSKCSVKLSRCLLNSSTLCLCVIEAIFINLLFC